MANGRTLNWRTFFGFVTVLLFTEATKIAAGENPLFSSERNSIEKRTDSRYNHKETPQSKKVLQDLGGARQNWWRPLLKSHEHQVKKSHRVNLGRDPTQLLKKGRQAAHFWWHGLENRLLAPRVHYATALYKKALPKDDVDIDDQPLIVLPPDDSPKTPELKHKPGGTRSVANGAVPPIPALPPAPPAPTPVVPTAPEMPVTEEVTVPPTISPTTHKAQSTAKPPVKPTKPAIINIIQPPIPTPKSPGSNNNATNIQLNLEIGESEPQEGVPVAPNPPQILTVPEAPTPPPPQIIIAQAPPTPPPPQPVVIHAAPTPPPAPQPIIIHDAHTPQQIIIHDTHDPPSAEPVFIHDESAPHSEPLVIASPPSPPSMVLASDVAPSQHSVVVAAPPQQTSLVVASQPASPGGAVTIMGLPSMQSPTSTLLMGQVPLQTQMSPMGYPMGMQLSPQSPFMFLPSPLMQSPLSPFAPPFPSAMPGLGSPLYDPQLLMSLTNQFSRALQTTLTQSQPNVLTSALVQAAIQAQTRNQPPDVLTAALTQALAQRMSPNNGQSDTNRLIQALTTALTQVQSQNSLPPVPAPAPVPAALPAMAQLPAAPAPSQVPTAYQVLPQPVAAQSIKDSANIDGQSFSNVGKALASALVRAARNLARQKRIYDRDGGGRERDFHRSRPYYSRSFASTMPRPYYPRSFGRRFGARDRSPISRRSKIARWYSPKHLPFQWTPLQSSCTCCGCC